MKLLEASGAYQEPLHDLIKFMVERGDTSERIAANVVRLNRVRDLLLQAKSASSCRARNRKIDLTKERSPGGNQA